jgi:3-oxoacyl-[acyl-carrier-protein] synthase-3
MLAGRPVGIAGMGFEVPARRVPNSWFTRYIETSDEWIVQRTGIRERRWLDDGEKPSDLFVGAGRKALMEAGIAPSEVDLVIVATVSGDFQGIPAAASLVQDRLGCTRAGAFDLGAGCAGFVYALATGAQFVASGTFQNVLVIGGEGLSRICDIYDRNSVIIFGDGAGAVLLRPHADCGQGLIEALRLGSDGAGADCIIRPRGGTAEPLTPEILSEGSHLVRLKGREIYRFAVDRMSELIAWALEGQDPEELSVVVPHQVNARILETATQRLGIPPEKVIINIDRYGNTSAASVPIALCEARDLGLLEPGSLVVLAAFGAGLAWGGARLRW